MEQNNDMKQLAQDLLDMAVAMGDYLLYSRKSIDDESSDRNGDLYSEMVDKIIKTVRDRNTFDIKQECEKIVWSNSRVYGSAFESLKGIMHGIEMGEYLSTHKETFTPDRMAKCLLNLSKEQVIFGKDLLRTDTSREYIDKARESSMGKRNTIETLIGSLDKENCDKVFKCLRLFVESESCTGNEKKLLSSIKALNSLKQIAREHGFGDIVDDHEIGD